MGATSRAMPRLPVIAARVSATRNGSANTAVTRAASACAPSRDASSITSANSSPPTRATVSPARTVAVSLAAMSTRSSSPAACPRLLFTSLKSSISSRSTATAEPCRSARTAARRTTVDQQGTIWQPGQVVVESLVAKRLLARVARGGVSGDPFEAARAARLHDEPARHFGEDVDAVLPDELHFDGLVGVGGDPLRDRLCGEGGVFGHDQIHHVHGQELFPAVAGETLGRPVQRAQPPVPVSRVDRVGCVLEQFLGGTEAA